MSCPACGKPVELPANLEFRGLERSTQADIERGEEMAGFLAISVIVGCCLPVAAWVWWWTSGAIGRARDEDRPVAPVLVRLRIAAAVATMLELLFWGLVLGIR